jgi:hypothetical protein
MGIQAFNSAYICIIVAGRSIGGERIPLFTRILLLRAFRERVPLFTLIPLLRAFRERVPLFTHIPLLRAFRERIPLLRVHASFS